MSVNNCQIQIVDILQTNEIAYTCDQESSDIFFFKDIHLFCDISFIFTPGERIFLNKSE